jgi:hypothetical protein
MPILSTDILFLLSAPGASAGYAQTGTVYNSLGKYCSTTQISSTPLDNLFTDLTGAENAASQVDYQCVFILNNTSSGDTALNGVVWLPLSGFVTGGANITMATDNIGATSKTSSSAQAAVIANSTTAPTGVSSYVAPSSTNSGGLSVPNLAPGSVFAVWIKRSATNSAPVNNDGFVIEYDFDTAA